MIVPNKNREPVSAPGPLKRGAALILALFAVVVLATIVSAAAFVSQQEYRGSRNTLIEQRAFAVSEFGLNSEISNWDRNRNLPPPVGRPIGYLDTTRIYVASGDSARIYIKRLSDNAFWVVSEGRANIGSSLLEAGRQTSAYVRIAYPSISPKGAITSAGNVRVAGSSEVNGYEHHPNGWPQCGSIPGDTVPAVVVAPGATVQSGPSNITSTPAVVYDPAASDSNTYVRYGSESWNTLTSNADIILPGGLFNSDIQPVANIPATVPPTCNTTLNTNWGEPLRPGVAACYGYYPIVYSQTSLKINGNGRAQGILLVNGDLEINGTFEFYGLVILRDDLVKGNGTAMIKGAVFAANLTDISPTSWLTGDQDVHYSTCAVESALRGSAILTRVTQRHWAQIF
ncbi:MAG TPA: pilus assembly PilX N-terminal domain-containing protein [Gemmatimonadaceae bacterium]|nr:pilus assembly PilX N-terminal domain-containing protein [Gemmatimonadaceae bacterium]